MKTCLAGFLAAGVALALATSANAGFMLNSGDFEDGDRVFAFGPNGSNPDYSSTHFNPFNGPENPFSATYMAIDPSNASVVVQHTGQADLLPDPSNFTRLSAQVSSTVSITDPGGDRVYANGFVETTGGFTIAAGDPQSYTLTLTATGQSVANDFGLGYVGSHADFFSFQTGYIASVTVGAGSNGTQSYTGTVILQPGSYSYLLSISDLGTTALDVTGSASLDLTPAPANAVPEPSSLVLGVLATLSLAGYGYRRRQCPV